MKKFILFITILLSLNFYGNAQFNNELLNDELTNKRTKYNKETNFLKAQEFFLNNNWDSTLVYSMLQLNSGNNNQELEDYCHYFRGISFKQKGLYHEANEEFLTNSENFHFYYKTLLGLGELSIQLNDFKKGLDYFEKIEKSYNLPEYEFNRSAFYHNVGICYLHLKEYSKSEHYLLKSMKLQQAKKDTLLLIGAYMDIANLYYEQYKDSLAIPYFEKAYQLSQKVNNFQIKQNAALNMAVVEENRNNFLKAIAYRKKYEQWRDSLNDQNKIWTIAELEKKFAVQQKEKEISLLEYENKVKLAQRNGLLASSILLLALFITGTFFYRQKVMANKIILSQKKELDELNSTKDKLFSIVSHDLRSSVNALKISNAKLAETINVNDNSTLGQLLRNNNSIANGAYNLLDNLLNWALMQTKQLYFHKESHHLYSVIQQITYNYEPLLTEKSLTLTLNISKNDFVWADLDSVKIIVRNLLDNAIKFSKQGGQISVYTLKSSDGFCHLVIEDKGIGMSKEMQEEILKDTHLLTRRKDEKTIGTGLGTQLCKLMIKKNNGKLLIESEPEAGTKMIILLPKTEHNG